MLGLAAGATFLTLLADPVQATFQAVERMRFLAYSDIISKTLQSLVGVALAVLGYGAVGLTTCWLVAAGIIVILNAWWVRPMVRVEWRTDLRRMRSLVRASLAYYAFGLFYMLYLWIDSVMLALMAPPRVVGWYGVPTKLFATLMFVPVIISTAWLPRLVNAFEQGADRLRATARAPIELVIVLALPICVAAAMTAGPVIHLLYGSSYGPSVPVLVVLVLALPFMYLNIMLNQVLIAANRPMTWTWVMAGAALVNPVLNFVLIRVCQSRLHNGAIGASISLVLTEVLVVVVGTFVVGRRVLGSLSVGRLGRAGMAAGAMWGAMFVTRRFTAVAELAAGGAVFVALVGILRLATEEEVALMRAGVTRLRGMLVPAGGRGGRE